MKSGLVESATTFSSSIFGMMLLQLEYYIDNLWPCWKASGVVSNGVVDTLERILIEEMFEHSPKGSMVAALEAPGLIEDQL